MGRCVSALEPNRSRTVETNCSGHDRLGQEGAGSGRHRLIGEIERRHRQHWSVTVACQPGAEVDTATGDHQIDDRQVRSTVGGQLLGARRVERHAHLVSLGPQEVLDEFRCVPISFGEQDHDRDALGVGLLQVVGALQLLGQQPVGVGGAGASIDQVDDEPQSFQLVTRVHALRALAPRRNHDAVAFLPGPKRRCLDAEHAGDRPDRVDRPAAQTRFRISHGHAAELSVRTSNVAASPVRSTSRITHRDGFTIDSLAPRARQQAWTATNSLRPDGVDERQPGTVQLDISVHPGEPGPDLGHAGEVELAQQPQLPRPFLHHTEHPRLSRRSFRGSGHKSAAQVRQYSNNSAETSRTSTRTFPGSGDDLGLNTTTAAARCSGCANARRCRSVKLPVTVCKVTRERHPQPVGQFAREVSRTPAEDPEFVFDQDNVDRFERASAGARYDSGSWR